MTPRLLLAVALLAAARLKKVQKLFDEIGGLQDPQCALLLLRHCAAFPVMNHAIRTAPFGWITAELRVSDDMVDAIVSPEIMNPIRDIVVHFKNSEMGQMMSAMPVMDEQSTRAGFAIDDSQFLLYSVGMDEDDDRAALVDDLGASGDMLFWPPTMSLYREYVNR